MSVFNLVVMSALIATRVQPSDDAIISYAYSRGSDRVKMCGFNAASFAEFETQLTGDSAFREEGSNDRYRVYVASAPEFRQIVIARPRETAFPMAYCRTLPILPNGSTTLQSRMHCEGEKKDCDAVFVEFYRHDQSILRSLGG